MGHRLGVRSDGRRRDDRLQPPSHAAVKRRVAREIDRLEVAGAEDHVRVARVETLDLGEHPVVEAQLMDDRGLDLLGELGVENLVAWSPSCERVSMRRRKSARPCQRPSKNCAW